MDYTLDYKQFIFFLKVYMYILTHIHTINLKVIRVNTYNDKSIESYVHKACDWSLWTATLEGKVLSCFQVWGFKNKRKHKIHTIISLSLSSIFDYKIWSNKLDYMMVWILFFLLFMYPYTNSCISLQQRRITLHNALTHKIRFTWS